MFAARHARTADIVALSHCQIHSLTKANFELVSASYPNQINRLRDTFHNILIKSVKSNNDKNLYAEKGTGSSRRSGRKKSRITRVSVGMKRLSKQLSTSVVSNIASFPSVVSNNGSMVSNNSSRRLLGTSLAVNATFKRRSLGVSRRSSYRTSSKVPRRSEEQSPASQTPNSPSMRRQNSSKMSVSSIDEAKIGT